MYYHDRAYTLDDLLLRAASCMINDDEGEVLISKKMGDEEFSERTKELLFYRSVLSDPKNRWMVNSERKHNVVVQIAETMWILAGRNDMDFLTRFLPRAATWADDKEHWRAGYGPRLRGYTGISYEEDGFTPYLGNPIDQLMETYEHLKTNPSSRQAVITIWDPTKDLTTKNSKDYPCNYAMHFIKRRGALHLHVNCRSNDLIWGYSGINVVEFTILQELMAGWLKWDLGEYIHSSDSLHVYEDMYDRLDNIEGAHESTTAQSNMLHRDLKHHQMKVPDIATSLQFIEDMCDLEMFMREDPVAARAAMAQWEPIRSEYPEFASLFILPICYDRPEMGNYVDMKHLHPALVYNLINFNSLKYGPHHHFIQTPTKS